MVLVSRLLKRLLIVAFAAVLLVVGGAGSIFALRQGALRTLFPPPDLEATRQQLMAQALRVPLAEPRIEVRKAERRLDLFDGDRLVRSYRVALGGSPIGHKTREGDGRTPEGTYRICTRLERSQFHLFLGLDYPAPSDAEGRADVSASERAAIEAAHRVGTRPPWDTALGGAVGIHGGGSHRDWTRGCLAVEDAEIEEIFLLTTMGAPVLVRP